MTKEINSKHVNPFTSRAAQEEKCSDQYFFVIPKKQQLRKFSYTLLPSCNYRVKLKLNAKFNNFKKRHALPKRLQLFIKQNQITVNRSLQLTI